MAMIQDRVPVVLPPGARDRWLDPAVNEAELREMLRPLPAEKLEVYPVSTIVNSPENDSPECIIQPETCQSKIEEENRRFQRN